MRMALYIRVSLWCCNIELCMILLKKGGVSDESGTDF